MIVSIKQQLQSINTKSQQLLERLEYDVESDEDLAEDEIAQLQSSREQLISHLFEQHSNSDIQNELELINKMVDLDTKLQVKAEELKQALANKLIKIQTGKKSALTYRKY